MTINIYFTKSPKNFFNKELERVATFPSLAIVRWDLDNPVFRMESSSFTMENLKRINYLQYVTQGQVFYYYITKKTYLMNKMMELEQHVDVLMTYKDIILQQYAIIDRQEKDWNLFLQDPMTQVYENQIIQQKLFPSKIDQNNFILTVAGG